MTSPCKHSVVARLIALWPPSNPGAVVMLRGLLLFPLVLLAGCPVSSGEGSPDPLVVENVIAFVKRPLPFDDATGGFMGDNAAEPAAFRPGARLLLKERGSSGPVTRDISSRVFAGSAFQKRDGDPLYDVKDLSVSFDGTRVVFAMRAPETGNADEGKGEEKQPTWNIWEYKRSDDSLERLILSDVTAEEGQDIAPAYLPDGRIVFASTRQLASRAVLIDEGKPQYSALEEERQVPAFVLHVMDAEGGSIEQITFNQSHDLDPVVQDDGSILFSRWDNAGETQNNGFNLYRVNPDGTGLTYVFGRHSHQSVSADTDIEYLKPRITDTGRILTELRPLRSANYGVVPSTVNIAEFVEADLAIDGSPGSGQSPLVNDLTIDDAISPNGNYGRVSPLLDGSHRYLLSWSPCRLQLSGGDGTVVHCTDDRLVSGDYDAAPPVYGLWLLDTIEKTQRPIERSAEGQQVGEAVLLAERSLPDSIPQAQYFGEDATLAANGYGVLDIRSVYDSDGVDVSPLGVARTADPAALAPDKLPVRFLRIEKPVSIPGRNVWGFDDTAFGLGQNQSMREIVGYVPIEPDGSVRVAVPADIAFAISVLDDEGQRINARHQNWLSLRAGETVSCNGCHNPTSDVAHGRPDASPASVYEGAQTTGTPFPNTRPGLLTDIGETMAQTWARINGTRMLDPDPTYVDQWTDPSVVSRADSFALAYVDLETPAPISPECAIEWTRACRIVINYEQHIHPLWSLDRSGLSADQESFDHTCTGCHASEDRAGAARIPAAQLDLTSGSSPAEPDHFAAYRELLFNDDGQLPEQGLLIEEPVTPPSGMSVAGAQASAGFFDLFRAGGAHEGFLDPAELRLISEWLDIGGQYYNNPFAVMGD